MNDARLDAPENDCSRRLGVAEEAMDLLERRRGAGHIVRIVALEGVAIVPGLLTKACLTVQRRHPILSAGIVESSGGPRFGRHNGSPHPVRVRSRSDEQTWLAIANAELNTKFERGDPLIRISLLTRRGVDRSEIVIACHHAIVDGESMTQITREVLLAYHALATGEPKVVEPSHDPRLPVEEALGYPLRPAFQAGRLREFILRQIELKDAGPLVTFDAASPDLTSSRSVLVHHSVPRDVVDALRTRSRAEGASVHAALGAALLLAGRHELLSRGSGTFALVSAASLRARLPQLRREGVGLCSSGVRTRHEVKPTTPFWDLARDVRHRVARALEHEEDVCGLMLQREAVDHYTESHERGFAWLSNPGELDLPAHVATGRVRASHGAVPIHAFGPVVHTHASTFGEQMAWNFVYPEPALRRSTVEAFARGAVDHLERAAQCEDVASVWTDP